MIVRGAMNAAWAKLGGATGELGAPMADQTENGDVVTQRFSGGAISWDRRTDKFTTEPAGLASELAGLRGARDSSSRRRRPAAGLRHRRETWFTWQWSVVVAAGA